MTLHTVNYAVTMNPKLNVYFLFHQVSTFLILPYDIQKHIFVILFVTCSVYTADG